MEPKEGRNMGEFGRVAGFMNISGMLAEWIALSASFLFLHESFFCTSWCVLVFILVSLCSAVHLLSSSSRVSEGHYNYQTYIHIEGYQ